MGYYKQSASLIVIVAALLLLTPLGYGQPADSAIFSGRICCTPTANCGTNTTVIPGVRVTLNCDSLMLGQGITNSIGVFNIIVDSLQAFGVDLTGGVSQCSLSFRSTVCPVLNDVNSFLAVVPVVWNSGLAIAIDLVSNLFVFMFDKH